MRIYISIPISNCNLIKQQYKAAHIANKLKALGHEPVNPFDTPNPPEHWNTDMKYAYYMGEDVKRLLLCDAILMCDGWENSVGCNIEHSIADIKKMVVFHSLDQIRKCKQP